MKSIKTKNSNVKSKDEYIKILLAKSKNANAKNAKNLIIYLESLKTNI